MPWRAFGVMTTMLTSHTLPTTVYAHPSQAGYLRPHEGHDVVTTRGPTSEALADLEVAAVGARLVIRTGNPRTGMATYIIVR